MSDDPLKVWRDGLDEPIPSFVEFLCSEENIFNIVPFIIGVSIILGILIELMFP